MDWTMDYLSLDRLEGRLEKKGLLLFGLLVGF
jgi:hypothetical protein